MEAFDKLSLTNNASVCPTAISQRFRPATRASDESVMFLQPVLHYTAPSSFQGTINPSYLVSTQPRLAQDYKVWRVRSLLLGAGPGNFQRVTVAARPYDRPPPATQPGTPQKLEVNDSRTLQAAGLGNTLWLVATERCNMGGGSDESCIRAVRLTVSQGLDFPVVTVNKELTLGLGPDAFAFMPGLALSQDERLIIPFLSSSAFEPLSFNWTQKLPSTDSFTAAQRALTGTCVRTAPDPQLDKARLRTGDYVAAQADPVTLNSFWLAGEASAVEPSNSSFCSWKTEVRLVP